MPSGSCISGCAMERSPGVLTTSIGLLWPMFALMPSLGFSAGWKTVNSWMTRNLIGCVVAATVQAEVPDAPMPLFMEGPQGLRPVSYTHLTLPTICSV